MTASAILSTLLALAAVPHDRAAPLDAERRRAVRSPERAALAYADAMRGGRFGLAQAVSMGPAHRLARAAAQPPLPVVLPSGELEIEELRRLADDRCEVIARTLVLGDAGFDYRALRFVVARQHGDWMTSEFGWIDDE